MTVGLLKSNFDFGACYLGEEGRRHGGPFLVLRLPTLFSATLSSHPSDFPTFTQAQFHTSPLYLFPNNLIKKIDIKEWFLFWVQIKPSIEGKEKRGSGELMV